MNRLPLGHSSERAYTILVSDSLRLGVAEMRIGEEGQAWSELYRLSTATAPGKRPRLNLENLSELTAIEEDTDLATLPDAAGQFFAAVNEALDQSLDKNLTVYIHGANSNVYRSCAQAAQYRNFTDRNPVVLAFAGPSAESLKA